MRKLRTSTLAKEAEIHPNTLRFYERVGLLSEVPRDPNGYRAYEPIHVLQLKVCRCIFPYGWLGKRARQITNRIIDNLVRNDFDQALVESNAYLAHLRHELETATTTADILHRWSQRRPVEVSGQYYSQNEMATIIGVTPEVLRNWERNDLIQVPRTFPNQKRQYTNKELERLRIIYVLRQANYSINAIHASFKEYDLGNADGVIKALNSPEADEDASWIYVGDRWIDALNAGIDGAVQIIDLIEDFIKNKPSSYSPPFT